MSFIYLPSTGKWETWKIEKRFSSQGTLTFWQEVREKLGNFD